MRKKPKGYTQPSNIVLVGLMHKAIKAISRENHKHGQINHAKMRVLTMISDNQPICQNSVLHLLGLRASSLSEVLSSLEQAGLVSRQRDHLDRRNYQLSLTEPGNELIKKYALERHKLADEIFSGFSEEERSTFGGLLAKLAWQLEEHHMASGGKDYVRDYARYNGLEGFAYAREDQDRGELE